MQSVRQGVDARPLTSITGVRHVQSVRQGVDARLLTDTYNLCIRGGYLTAYFHYRSRTGKICLPGGGCMTTYFHYRSQTHTICLSGSGYLTAYFHYRVGQVQSVHHGVDV